MSAVSVERRSFRLYRNTSVSLEPAGYDFVSCIASLHHLASPPR
jgi:hypothetical protein